MHLFKVMVAQWSSCRIGDSHGDPPSPPETPPPPLSHLFTSGSLRDPVPCDVPENSLDVFSPPLPPQSSASPCRDRFLGDCSSSEALLVALASKPVVRVGSTPVGGCCDGRTTTGRTPAAGSIRSSSTLKFDGSPWSSSTSEFACSSQSYAEVVCPPPPWKVVTLGVTEFLSIFIRLLIKHETL
jgi:hypothetical protein